MNIFKNIDSKTITSAGGIILAGFLAFTIYKILTNDLTHINSSIEKQAEIQKDTNAILIDNARAIEGNTKVLESLQILILRK